MRIEHAIDIDASPERVWEITLDVETWPQYIPTIDSIERLDDGPLMLGSRARIKQPGLRPLAWTVSVLDHERTFAWGTRVLGMSMTGGHHLEPNGSGTTHTLSIEFTGPLAAILGPLLRRPIVSTITKENEGFKSAAEAN